MEMRFREATPDEAALFSMNALITSVEFPFAFAPIDNGSGCWLAVSSYLQDRFGRPEFNRPRGCHPAWIHDTFDNGRGKEWRVVLFLRTQKDAFEFKMRWC
jgi:hypothetical protein